MKKIRLILIAVVLFSIFGCNTSQKRESNEIYKIIVDDYDREVILTEEPETIISLSPGITEIIYALHSEDKLIGRSEYCAYPPQVKEIPSVGGISDVNVEKIVEFNPDLVLIGSMVPKQVVDFLTEANIQTIAVKEKNSFNGVYENIQSVASVLNKEKEAEMLIDSLKMLMEELTYNMESKDKPKVYYVVGYGKSGDYTAGGDTYIQDIITLSGGKNIAEDLKGWSFSRELLFERDPDYIFIRKEDYNDFIKSKPYDELSAVKNNKVFPIESALMDVQGPRSIEAVQFISQTINPEK